MSGMRSSPANAPMQTPVDLQSYSMHQGSRPPAGAAIASSEPRFTISRRPALDLPAPATRMGRGGGGMEAPGAGERTGTDANFELDVPAFLDDAEEPPRIHLGLRPEL